MVFLKRFFDWLFLVRELTCQVYCPGCRKELVGSDSHCHEVKDGLVWYECDNCLLKSQWDFDLPAPRLISVI